MMKKLKNWITRVPDSIKPEQRRTYNVVLLSGGLGGLFHLMALVIFATFGVTPLVYVNIGSVSLFAVAFVLVRRKGLVSLSMILATVELITHQVLAVYFMGWGSGYQYYLFGTAGFIFMGHFRSRVIPALCVLLNIVAFGWLYFYGQHLYHHHFSMPESVRIVLFWWNIFWAMVGVAVTSFVYARTAIRMERELAEQNQELRDAQVMLVQSERMAAIGKLAAGLAHEINTAISVILSNTQTGTRVVERLQAQESAAKSTGDTAGRTMRLFGVLGQSLESTNDGAQRLGELVRRLQNFVRLDEAEVKSADLHEGIESTLALLQNQTQAGSIEVIRCFDETLPKLLCRPAEINQVLMNLLQNAIDAIEGPGTITITMSHNPEQVSIAIRDTGRGLKPEKLEDLFDFSFSSNYSRVKLGMGYPSLIKSSSSIVGNCASIAHLVRGARSP
ncbi:ATP-binding protein [bacterium]|nr:ATP-binding protein [bacterium]